MDICDTLDRWDDMSYGDRLQAMRDYVRDEAESWGMDAPSVQAGRAVDEEGNEHWAQYDNETDTITVDPRVIRGETEGADGAGVFDSLSHEMRHAMQDQYEDDVDTEEGGEDAFEDPNWMDDDERQEDAEDFADAMSDYLEDECEDEDSESAPGSGGPGDWNLPPEGVTYA